MVELLVLFALIAGGLIVVAIVAFLGFLLKVGLKIVLFPLWLLVLMLKGLLVLLAVVAGLVLAPIALLLLFLLGLPLLALAALFGLGWSMAVA
jgi:hypothetical protein